MSTHWFDGAGEAYSSRRAAEFWWFFSSPVHQTASRRTRMSRKIFVNLPVKDLGNSVDFFTSLGFEFNPQFTDDHATCMGLSDEAFVMLLVEDFFSTFTTKAVCDPVTHVEAILAVSAASRQEVDDLVDKALAAGGQPAGDPVDQGFMYGRSFQDLDGHIWEVIWMDMAAVPAS
jgi:hypothetical protein